MSLLITLSAVARANSYTVDFQALGGIEFFPVGDGSFSFNGTYGDGTYQLSALPNYAMSFEIQYFGSFSAADMVTDPSQVLVIVSDRGSQFIFDGPGRLSVGIELKNAAGDYLFMQQRAFPNEFAAIQGSTGNEIDGVYNTGTSQIPEPIYLGVVVLGLGLITAWPASRRRIARQRHQITETGSAL